MTPGRAGYAFFVALALVVGAWVQRTEKRRLGMPGGNQGLALTAGAVLGGVLGSKLLMVLYVPPGDWGAILDELKSLDFDGKTVIGGLTGGYVGVELAKRLAGVRRSTGDAWAVALPVAHAIGRLGCLANGCCYGGETGLAAWGPAFARHPAQVYEMVGNLALAAFLWSIREQPRAPGQLFRMYLVGYAAIRFLCDPFRGDAHVWLGPLSFVQWYCLAVGAGFAVWIARASR
ncbi:MAG: prolipoprotein diacylglyceryl transferase [Alphaproteobacteria bacterium]|nr:prolipoprotein diacylglyceryl transferase [Alphaproteobacteria bacterium]